MDNNMIQNEDDERLPSVERLHRGDRGAILLSVYEQEKEISKQEEAYVTCPCGRRGPIKRSFKCLYCEVFFCPSCAKEHFE